MRVAAIILAAGASRRLGQPKQLVMHAGEPLLKRALRLAAEAGASPVFPVLGAGFADICVSISFDNTIPVYNDRWQSGMASSIYAGLHELDVRAPEADAALLMTCDMPQLTCDHLRTLINLARAAASPMIVASTYAGTTGIPAVFPRSTFSALRTLHGDKGARELLAHPPCALVTHACKGCEVDIDVPADLARLR